MLATFSLKYDHPFFYSYLEVYKKSKVKKSKFPAILNAVRTPNNINQRHLIYSI